MLRIQFCVFVPCLYALIYFRCLCLCYTVIDLTNKVHNYNNLSLKFNQFFPANMECSHLVELRNPALRICEMLPRDGDRPRVVLSKTLTRSGNGGGGQRGPCSQGQRSVLQRQWREAKTSTSSWRTTNPCTLIRI